MAALAPSSCPWQQHWLALFVYFPKVFVFWRYKHALARSLSIVVFLSAAALALTNNPASPASLRFLLRVELVLKALLTLVGGSLSLACCFIYETIEKGEAAAARSI